MKRKFMFNSMCFAMLITSSINCFAAERILVTPNCLVAKVKSTHYEMLTKNKQLSLVKTDTDQLDEFVLAKDHQKTVCGGFLDVTEEFKTYQQKPNANLKQFLASYLPKNEYQSHTYKIQYEKIVNTLLADINPQALWQDLTTLSSFTNRSASTDDGVAAAKWFVEQMQNIAAQTGHDDLTISTIEAKGYKQPSVVAKLGNGDGPGIVIGGHMDTLTGIKPGADDDGSGAITVLETARMILSNHLKFKKPIYFIWYAAEERGLAGSKYVVKDFIQKKIPIDAVLQLDMTGYANDSTMWLILDFVNPDLMKYLKTLIDTYVHQQVDFTYCGYACSDHASWTEEGFTAAIPFEAKFGHYNPNIHTSKDTIDYLSLNHMTDFLKLAIAFAVELAEPV